MKKEQRGPGYIGPKRAAVAPRWVAPVEVYPYGEFVKLAGFIAVASFLSSLCLVTFAFWDYSGWAASLVGLTLALILGVAALIAWGVVGATVD